MKTRTPFLPIFASGLAGAAFVMLGTAAFFTVLPLETLLAGSVSVALIYFAVWDYARRPKGLKLKPGILLRPSLPVTDAPGIEDTVTRRTAGAERTVA